MRKIEFEGSFNFRDLGGWRTADDRAVRWGRVFRADSVHLLTPADVVRARDEIGLRTLLDLRSDLEVEFTGKGLLADAGLGRHHLPLTGRRDGIIDGAQSDASINDRSPDKMVENYLGMLEVSSDLLVDAVGAIASDDTLPAVFFCAAGKDRTGVLSAVILGSLDVRDEDIVQDYVLTNDSIVRIIERFAGMTGSPDMYRDLPPTHFAPYAETMERVIAHVRQDYGSFADYLVAKGLAGESLEALRGGLLETP
ncbi:MAG: tyrosine-protein phosphatase [Actinomycetota bacterium]